MNLKEIATAFGKRYSLNLRQDKEITGPQTGYCFFKPKWHKTERLLFCMLLLTLCSCSDQGNSLSVKTQFDKIEKITGTDNWQLVNKADTSYLYFSRQADLQINIYSYRIEKGDSTDTQLSKITATKDSVYWNLSNEVLYLSNITDAAMQWQSISNKSNDYRYQKKDSTSMLLLTNGEELNLRKTVALSAFLVRAKYDYEQGTNLAQKDTAFRRRRN